MPIHSVIFNVERVPAGQPQHSELVTLIWAVFASSPLGKRKVQAMHDAQTFSPFTWSYTMNGNEVSLSFSALPDEVIQPFIASLKTLTGIAITVPGCAFKIKSVFPQEDLAFLMPRMTLRAQSGINVTCGGTGHKKPLWYESDNTRWLKRIEEGLIRKADFFCPGKEHTAHVDRVRKSFITKTLYHGANLCYPAYTFRLQADEDTMKVALYAGVGQHTGIGFGHCAV